MSPLAVIGLVVAGLVLLDALLIGGLMLGRRVVTRRRAAVVDVTDPASIPASIVLPDADAASAVSDDQPTG